MDFSTIENAVFFLDGFTYAQMASGKELRREEFQVCIPPSPFNIRRK